MELPDLNGPFICIIYTRLQNFQVLFFSTLTDEIPSCAAQFHTQTPDGAGQFIPVSETFQENIANFSRRCGIQNPLNIFTFAQSSADMRDILQIRLIVSDR